MKNCPHCGAKLVCKACGKSTEVRSRKAVILELSESALDDIDKAAEKCGMNRSQFLRQAAKKLSQDK